MDQVTGQQTGQIAAAIAAATGSIGYVRQTGQNTHHRYAYASDEDLARAVNPALVAHGLAIAPINMTHAREGKSVIVTVTWEIRHSSGESMQMMTIGEDADRGDGKAVYKCMTGARKYLLRLLFCIATGDDAEQHTPAPPAPRLPEPVIPEGQTAQDVLYRMARESAGDDTDRLAKSIDYIDGLTDAQARVTLARKQQGKT